MSTTMYNLKILNQYSNNQATETNCIWHCLHHKTENPITVIRYINDNYYGIKFDVYYK